MKTKRSRDERALQREGTLQEVINAELKTLEQEAVRSAYGNTVCRDLAIRDMMQQDPWGRPFDSILGMG